MTKKIYTVKEFKGRHICFVETDEMIFMRPSLNGIKIGDCVELFLDKSINTGHIVLARIVKK